MSGLMALRRALLARAAQGKVPPPGYRRVEYAYNTEPTLINTGLYPDVDNYELAVTVKPQSGSFYVLQARRTNQGPIYGISGSRDGDTITAIWSGLTLTSAITRGDNPLRIRLSALAGTLTLTVEDLVSGALDSVSGQYSFEPLAYPVAVYGNAVATTPAQRVAAGTRIYAVSIRRGGVTVLDYLPCVHDAVTGFWDFAARRFVTPDEGALAHGAYL